MSNIQQKSRLTFIEQTVFGRESRALYLCECGTIKQIRVANVKRGTTYSCGCLKKEQDNIHGLHQHPLYKIWIGIKQRCYYKKSISYKYYGAKGVVMSGEWVNNPEAFIKWALENGWEKGLRIDKDIKAKQLGVPALLYSPERCQIVSDKKNHNNKSSNHLIEWNGKTQTLQQWAEEIGMVNETLRRRIRRMGWSIEKALTTPSKKYNYGSGK